MFDVVIASSSHAPGNPIVTAVIEEAALKVKAVLEEVWLDLFQVEGLAVFIRPVKRAPTPTEVAEAGFASSGSFPFEPPGVEAGGVITGITAAEDEEEEEGEA